jgi:hypothetical protein
VPKEWKKDKSTSADAPNLTALRTEINNAARRVGLSATDAQKSLRGTGVPIDGELLSQFISALGGSTRYNEVRTQFRKFHFV